VNWQKSRGKTPLPTASKSETKTATRDTATRDTATRDNDTGGGLKDVIARLEQQHSAIIRPRTPDCGLEAPLGSEEKSCEESLGACREDLFLTGRGSATY
jgi:hypothetical protein